MSVQVTALLAATLWLHAAAVPTGNHTCTGVIKHPVTVLVNVTEPVTFRSYTWCLRVPPRCSKYTVQLKDRVRLHTEMHNKTITVCCRGFVEMENRCVPACPEGADCPFMKCNRTNHCHCTPGYTGLYCNDACPRGLWGKDCKRPCDCPAGYTCHHLTGDCFVDDRPPRRTTTTKTTTKRPTTTTTTPSPTTEGTTMETVKTPVFRFPPPPWVDSASTVKKTTTRQVKKEDEPQTKMMDATDATPGLVVNENTATKVLKELTLMTLPTTVRMTGKPSVERPPILEFPPPLPNEGQTITEQIRTASTKSKEPGPLKITQTHTDVSTAFSKAREETTEGYLVVDTSAPTTQTKLFEQTAGITPPNPKPLLKTFSEVIGFMTETPLMTESFKINVTSIPHTTIETTPMATKSYVHPVQSFVTTETRQLQTVRNETSTTTTSAPITTKATYPTAKLSNITTQQAIQNTYVTHDTGSAENKLENEILTKMQDILGNKNDLEEPKPATTTDESNFRTKSTLDPFIVIPFTKPKQTEPVKKEDKINELGEMKHENQNFTVTTKIYMPTESINFEVIDSQEKKIEETKTTEMKANEEIGNSKNDELLKTDFVPAASSTKTFLTPVSPKTTSVPASALNNRHSSIPVPTTHTEIEVIAASDFPMTVTPAVLTSTKVITTSANTVPSIIYPASVPSHTSISTIDLATTVPSTAVTIPLTTAPTISPTTVSQTTVIPTTVTTAATIPTSTTTPLPDTTITTTSTTASSASATSSVITALSTTNTPTTTVTTSIPITHQAVPKAEVTYDFSRPQTTQLYQPTLPIPAIVEEIFKELNIHKKKLDEAPISHTGPDKLKKKHEKIKAKNINVKESLSIHQTKVEKYNETSLQPTTKVTFKSLLHAETFMNTSFSTHSPLKVEKQHIPEFINSKYVTEKIPGVEITSNGPMPINPNQIWYPFRKNNNSDTDLKEQEQFGVLKEPSKFSQTSMDTTEVNRVIESNTIDYHQSSEEPLKKIISKEEETNYSLTFNKIKFNMTESVAAGVKASRNQGSYLHIPMILVLGIALVTLLLLTLTLWVYLKRRRERQEPFPPCIMAYAMQEPTPLDSDSFDHPFFCPTFTNNYGERINRELRELSYDHPRSSRQLEPLYAEVRY